MSAGEWVAVAAAICGVLCWPVGLLWVQWTERHEHRHEWVRLGYGGAGWSVYECACGAKEIDA